MNNKLFSNADIVSMCIALLIILIYLLCSPLCSISAEDTTNESAAQISVYDNEYVEIDTDIISGIKAYFNDKYNNMSLISINIDHLKDSISVHVSIASDKHIDSVYYYTLDKVKYLNEYREDFYEIQDIDNWNYIVNEIKYMAKDIRNNSNIDSIDNFKLSVLNEEDYNTIWITVDNNDKVIYDSLENIYRQNNG